MSSPNEPPLQDIVANRMRIARILTRLDQEAAGREPSNADLRAAEERALARLHDQYPHLMDELASTPVDTEHP